MKTPRFGTACSSAAAAARMAPPPGLLSVALLIIVASAPPTSSSLRAAGAADGTAAAALGGEVLLSATLTTTVFRAESEGYHTFRIPGLLSHGSTVIALAEGRARVGGPGAVCDGPSGKWTNNTCCFGVLASHYDGQCRDKDVVIKRSTDGGHTFGRVVAVARANATFFYSNLMGVFDHTRLVLMYSRCEVTTSPPGGESYATCVPVLRISHDLGRTLSSPIDLPVARGIGGPTLGLALRLKQQHNTTRVLFPFQCAPKFSSCVLYSDDAGLDPSSWKVSAPDFTSTLPSYGMECSVSEVKGDDGCTGLVMLSRNSNR